ncbi:putative reverse transcriptase domain-containing protein [Tanacetum coccineum]|uniref:Reverse transcriptase domain-containing protein n=1 Tax=Tanacetum coccineum TaxID=301880 RepID=A0ABQ5BQA0_9ASTR
MELTTVSLHHITLKLVVKLKTRTGLLKILEKTVKDNPAIWSRKLDDALWAFRTAYKTPTDTTPYKLIYGKNRHLPFEIEHHAYWALKNYNLDLITVGEKRMFQLHELDELRHQAYENSRLYKARTKVWHDRKPRMRKEFKHGNKVHSTFHVSNLKKCYFDEPLAVSLDGLHIDDKLHFVEEPVEIVDREVKQLKQSRVPIVKVQWNFRRGPEFTWECEDQFQKKYPHLFTKIEVRAAVVASPIGVLKLDTHSSSEVDPSKSSPPFVSVAPMVSPFLCLDDSELDTKMPERHVSPTPHDTMLTRWRSRVASRSSSPTTSNPEIPTTPILPTPSAIVAPSSEALTIRKSIRPLPSHRLALRYTSHHFDGFTSGSSSDHSSLDHSSSGHSILGHSLSRHASPDTTIDDSSTPPRFVYPPLSRTLRCCKAYLRWGFAPLSTMSFAATVTSAIHATRALVPSRDDLLPPRKRFRDSISPEDSVEEDINTDMLEDIAADVIDVEVAVDRDVEAGVNAGIGMKVDDGIDVEDAVEDEVESSGTIEVRVDMVVRIDIPDGILMPNVVERLEQAEEGLQNIYEHVIEIPLQRIEDIKTGQRELEARSLIAYLSRQSKNSLTDEWKNRWLLMRRPVLRMLSRLKVKAKTAANGDNGNGGNRNGRDGNGGNRNRRDGNGGNGNCENGNPNENNRGVRPVTREFTYQDFIKCQPLNFMGTEGVVRLISALTWWNSHKRTIRADAAFVMSWRELMKLMAKNNDLATYTQRFQELTMLCTKMVLEEEDRVEKFIGGLPDNIQGNMIAAEPKRLMDQKLKGYAMKNAKNKRKFDNSQKDNSGQQGHYRSDCPKLKDQNRGNKTRNKNGVGKARGKAYVLGGGYASPDSNVVTAENTAVLTEVSTASVKIQQYFESTADAI